MRKQHFYTFVYTGAGNGNFTKIFAHDSFLAAWKSEKRWKELCKYGISEIISRKEVEKIIGKKNIPELLEKHSMKVTCDYARWKDVIIKNHWCSVTVGAGGI